MATTDLLLGMVVEDGRIARRAYREFVEAGMGSYEWELPLLARGLRLNCLTRAYEQLWHEVAGP